MKKQFWVIASVTSLLLAACSGDPEVADDEATQTEAHADEGQALPSDFRVVAATHGGLLGTYGEDEQAAPTHLALYGSELTQTWSVSLADAVPADYDRGVITDAGYSVADDVVYVWRPGTQPGSGTDDPEQPAVGLGVVDATNGEVRATELMVPKSSSPEVHSSGLLHLSSYFFDANLDALDGLLTAGTTNRGKELFAAAGYDHVIDTFGIAGPLIGTEGGTVTVPFTVHSDTGGDTQLMVSAQRLGNVPIGELATCEEADNSLATADPVVSLSGTWVATGYMAYRVADGHHTCLSERVGGDFETVAVDDDGTTLLQTSDDLWIVDPDATTYRSGAAQIAFLSADFAVTHHGQAMSRAEFDATLAEAQPLP